MEAIDDGCVCHHNVWHYHLYGIGNDFGGIKVRDRCGNIGCNRDGLHQHRKKHDVSGEVEIALNDLYTSQKSPALSDIKSDRRADCSNHDGVDITGVLC